MATAATVTPFAERFTNPKAVKAGKRCGDAKFEKHEHPVHASGKRVYDKESTGLIVPGGGEHGSPSPKSCSRPVYKSVIKVTQPGRVEAGLVLGSPERLQKSAERLREVNGHPKGKAQNISVLPGELPQKWVSGFMSETESSARRAHKIAAERAAFPPKKRQPNPWERPGMNPTAAINSHAGHGVFMNVILHNQPDCDVAPEELQRAIATGAAGSVGRCIVDYKDTLNGSKRTGSPEGGATVDRIASLVFNHSTVGGVPATPPLDLSKLKLGKRTSIAHAKKSAQWTARNDISKMGERKRLFSARRIAGAAPWINGNPTPRKPSGRIANPTAAARKIHMSFGTNAAVATQGESSNNASTFGSDANGKSLSGSDQLLLQQSNSGASSPKPTKKFLVEHRATSADNVFARDNHKVARLDCGSIGFSASPSRSADSLAIDSPMMRSVSSLNGNGVEPAIGASVKREDRGKKVTAGQANSSLDGVFFPSPMNKKAREFTGVVSPFGLHTNQSPTKAASPARIGW